MDNAAYYNQYRNRTNRYRVAIDDIVRVVFYGRVSTQHEAQISALSNQLLWYDSILKDHPNWFYAERTLHYLHQYRQKLLAHFCASYRYIYSQPSSMKPR